MATLQDGVDAFERGDDVGAREILNTLLDADSTLVDAWMWLATIAEAKHDLVEQKHCLEAIVAIDANNAEARRTLLRIRRIGGDALQSQSVTALSVKSDAPAVSASMEQQPSSTNGNEVPAIPNVGNVQASIPRKTVARVTPRLEKSGAPLWDSFFSDEGAMLAHVPNLLLDVVAALNEFGKDAIRLEQLRVKASAGDDDARRTLMVAVLRSGVDAAVALNDGVSSGQAFWVANAFYEAGKIVSIRERNTTPKLMERLLEVAADATMRLLPSALPIDEAQLVVERVITRAHRTRYAGRNFVPVRPDLGLIERLVFEAVAAHFDRRLAEMVESDRPSINEYVSTNMPKLYRMRLSAYWLERRDAWEEAIIAAGYDDTLRSLKSLGQLVRIDQIGIILPDTQNQIRLAADAGDYVSVRKLLEPSEKELKNLLYKETQSELIFREPPQPHLKPQHRELWKAAMRTLRIEGTKAAVAKVSYIWGEDHTNYDIRDWVAYLHAQDGNKLQAERFLGDVRASRKTEQNFSADWNLAVIYGQRHEETRAYELLLPLLKTNPTDERLIKVLLGLARWLNEHEGFLKLIPQSRTLLYHPVAFTLAAEMKDPRAGDILTQMISRWDNQWELPHVSTRYKTEQELMKVVTSGIVAGQLVQVTAWLRARIADTPWWIPNYIVLANVLETEHRDVDGAFQALADACKARRSDDARRDTSYRDLLDLCRRAKRDDLEQKAYEVAKRGRASDSVLKSFRVKSIPAQVVPPNDTLPSPQPSLPQSPRPATREEPNATWIAAKLARIRDVGSFNKEQGSLEEFSTLLSKHYPDTSIQIVPWLKDLSKIISQFALAESESAYSDRLVLYNRATTIERDFTRHLQSGALPTELVEVMTPYHEALKRVVSDLSRAAGVGPKVEIAILNPFIAPDVQRTTVVVQLRNTTNGERTITDVVVELRAEQNLATITPRQRSIRKLEASHTAELNFTVALDPTIRSASEVTLDVYVRASVEGFLNNDQPIAQMKLPVKTLRSAINRDDIPKLFIDSSPLDRLSPLFQGRDALMQRIRNSLYGGTQRERLFLDGIRRVGKSSIVNSVPLHVPEDVIAVPLRMEKFGLQAPLDTASVLWKIAREIEVAYTAQEIIPPPLPAIVTIDSCSGYIASIKALTGKTPLLMIDEFQKMLQKIKETGSNAEVILDILRAGMEDRSIFGLFTGSVRFDRLSTIVPHRIFGNITRLRVSFLNDTDVAAILRAGFASWVTLSEGAVKRIYDLTAGYPYIVQKFGSFLVNLLNEERRCVVSAEDVDRVATADVLSDDTIFLKNWWPEHFAVAEERAIEVFFHHFPDSVSVPIDDFLAKTERREVDSMRTALRNLQSCEVLDSTAVGQIRFTAEIVRQWLRSHYHEAERRLRIPVTREESVAVTVEPRQLPGQVGVYIDHENFVKSLARIRIARTGTSEANARWFDGSLKQVLDEVEKRLGRIDQKVAVAFWDRPDEMRLQSSYTSRDFDVRAPERTGKGNEADFKLADEIRRSMEQVKREGASLRHAVVITGDADFSNVISGLRNDGVNVHVWAGGKSASQTLVNLVGPSNVVMLDDICGP
jgi:hypothetical protein